MNKWNWLLIIAVSILVLNAVLLLLRFIINRIKVNLKRKQAIRRMKEKEAEYDARPEGIRAMVSKIKANSGAVALLQDIQSYLDSHEDIRHIQVTHLSSFGDEPKFGIEVGDAFFCFAEYKECMQLLCNFDVIPLIAMIYLVKLANPQFVYVHEPTYKGTGILGTGKEMETPFDVLTAIKKNHDMAYIEDIMSEVLILWRKGERITSLFHEEEA